MAHQDIRRLTNELDAAKNNNLEPSGVLQRFIEEITGSEYYNFQQLHKVTKYQSTRT